MSEEPIYLFSNLFLRPSAFKSSKWVLRLFCIFIANTIFETMVPLEQFMKEEKGLFGLV